MMRGEVRERSAPARVDHKAPRALVGATEIGGSRAAPSRVTSKASTTTKTSHGTPIQRTPVPVKVKVAVAPAAEPYTARSPLSATPESALVVSFQASLGASVPPVSSERARVSVGTGALATFTVTVADVGMLPVVSRARAARRWGPSGTVRVSHATS